MSFFRRSSPFWIVLALASETVLYFSYHPLQQNPVPGVLVLLLNGVVSIGLLFHQRWVNTFWFLALLFIAGVGFLSSVLGNGADLWETCLYLGFVLTLVSIFAPYQWSYSLLDECDEREWLTGGLGQVVRCFLPRSRLAVCEAAACVCFGLTVYFVFRDFGLGEAGVVFLVPELVLAVAFWFHQGWVRWYGPLLCLGWALLMVWAVNADGFDPMHVGNYLAFLFLAAAMRLRRVSWVW